VTKLRQKREGRRIKNEPQGRFNLSIAPELINQVKARASDLGVDVNQYLSTLAKRDIACGGELGLVPQSSVHKETQVAMPWEEVWNLVIRVQGWPPEYQHKMTQRDRDYQIVMALPDALALRQLAGEMGEQGSKLWEDLFSSDWWFKATYEDLRSLTLRIQWWLRLWDALGVSRKENYEHLMETLLEGTRLKGKTK
jgi:hypothetical protein